MNVIEKIKYFSYESEGGFCTDRKVPTWKLDKKLKRLLANV